MAISWEPEERPDRPHRSLDPVSAWLLATSAPQAGRAGADAGAPRHVGIIDVPDGTDTPRSEGILVLDAGLGGGSAVSQSAIDVALAGVVPSMQNPRVFLLPLHPHALPELPSPGSVLPSGPPRSVLPWLPSSPPPSAIVGVIDHAINIFHHRFQITPGGNRQTRVAYAWMQGAAFDPGNPSAVPFGREWTRDEMAELLANPEMGEDDLLRSIGVDHSVAGLHPLALRAGHGTHVMDLAAGMDPEDGRGRDIPIIAVNLPPEVARETTGSVLSLFFLQAFDYILSRARTIMREIGVAVPVLINFSFSLTGGPRHGRHFVERVMQAGIRHHQELIAADGAIQGEASVRVFVPAGNRNLTRGHVATTGNAVLNAIWQAQPSDPSANHCEVLIKVAAGAEDPRLRLTMSEPGQDASISIEFTSGGQATLLRDEAGGTLGRALLVSEGAVDDGTNELFRLAITLGATDPGYTGQPALPPGAWGLRVEVEGVEPVRMDAWILRDDVPPGFLDTGRQSYFIDPAYSARDRTGRLITADASDALDGLQRRGTLNAIATRGTQTVVGGVYGRSASGLVTHSPRAAPYSATPLPLQSGILEEVDISAPCERSLLLSGVLAAGNRSGGRVALNGTSVASPQVLRLNWEGAEASESSSAVTLAEEGGQLGKTVTTGTVARQIDDTELH